MIIMTLMFWHMSLDGDSVAANGIFDAYIDKYMRIKPTAQVASGKSLNCI
jgi:hypothetical protein